MNFKTIQFASLLLLAGVVAMPASAVDVVDFSKESPQLQLQKMRQQNAEMQLQINKFHQEFMSLRGEIEQLQYKISELEKARQIELDAQKNANVIENVAPVAGDAPLQPQVVGEAPDPELVKSAIARGDIASYQTAFNDLKLKKYDKAREGLNSYLAAYPKGEYAANAHYWLGELYLLSNDSQLATKSFSTVVADYSTHSKADDARFKLAQIYNRDGDDEKSKALLSVLLDSKSDNQRIKDLAQSFKDEHYP